MLRAHLPLIALGVVSTCVIFYLWRELQRAKKELLTSENCTDALCESAPEAPAAPKRVRFETPGRDDLKPAAAAGAPQPPAPELPQQQQQQAPAPAPQAPLPPPEAPATTGLRSRRQAAAAATPAPRALDSAE